MTGSPEMDRPKTKPRKKTLFNRIVTPKLRRKMRYPWGRVTARWRQLPGAIVIGTQKGGTSSMFRYLLQHPQYHGAINKEVHFFDYRYDKGLAWYRAMFPLRSRLPEGSVTGEASPFYLYHPLVPARMAASLPEVKLIVLLRDPVDRAFSHYYHNVRRGRSQLPVLEAFDREQELIGPEKARLARGEDFRPHNFRYFAYTERGLYADQLERWFRHFPREQFFIRNSEEFYTGGQAFMREVFDFLGIDPDYRISDFTPGNVGIERTEDPALRARLEAYFAPHNRRLEALLGLSYGWPGQTPITAAAGAP
jgi:hypothetical protein